MPPLTTSGPPRNVSQLADPRLSVIPAVVVFVLGLGLFLVDATVSVRPGPLAYLLTPTAVALLLYLRGRPTTSKGRLVALAIWGLVGTAAAGLLTIIVAIGTRLPRPYEAWELFLLDLGVFVWFVLALSGAFAVAARTRGWRSLIALLAGPIAQVAGFLLTVVFTAEDVVLVVLAA